MAELTKEWLQNTITSIESARDEMPFGLDEDQSNMLNAFKIALASMEAEPVAWTDDGRDQFESLIRFHADDKNHETLLLRANGGMNYQDPNVDLAWIFWKSSREHMLQDKGEPDKQVCELTMLVKRLASSLKSVNKSSNLPDKAMEYLKQNGMVGVEDILR